VPPATNPHSRTPSLRNTFQALQEPRYRLLWWGTVFSFLGMQMQMIARGYLAYDLTGSNTALGGVMIAFGVPQLVFGLWGGVVADRMAKRNVLIFWQAAIALASGLMAVAIATDHLAYWMLIATGVLTGTAFAFIGPARQAFIGDLVPAQMMGNAIVLQQASMNGTRVFGPALAGVLIATPLVGMAGVYALTTLGFIVATVSMVRLPLGRPNQINRRSAMAETRDGLRYVSRNRPVAILLAMSFFVVALGFPYQGFLASVARDEFHVGATGLGGLSSLAAVGALAATLWVANLTGHRHAWRIQALAGAGFGVSLILFALSPNFVIGLVTILFLGALASAFQSLNNALTMVLAERQYYGRVQALMGVSWSLFGILSLPLGLVADAIGIRATLALMGVATLISVAAMQGLTYLLSVNTDVRQDTSGEMVVAAGEADGAAEDAAMPVLVKPGSR
jgi:predicted MFS family arabinose efflux permease